MLLKDHHLEQRDKSFKSLLNGVIRQDTDRRIETAEDFTVVTTKAPTEQETADLIFANKCAKHLKSNTIALVRNNQLLGMGCGQTSRVDALKQAIDKAGRFGFDLKGAVMLPTPFSPSPTAWKLPTGPVSPPSFSPAVLSRTRIVSTTVMRTAWRW